MKFEIVQNIPFFERGQIYDTEKCYSSSIPVFTEGYCFKHPEWFREIKKEFKVGDWVRSKNPDNKFFFRIIEVNDKDCKGAGLNYDGEWYSGNYWTNTDTIKATKDEIETMLIKEAKRRGFKPGIKVNREEICLNIRNNVVTLCGSREDYYYLVDEFFYGEYLVYKEGKWAEVFQEPFKVGDWVTIINLNGDVLGKIGASYKIERITEDGFHVQSECTEEIRGGSWFAKNLRLATEEEIETTLIREAKRRNFKAGTMIYRSRLMPAESDMVKLENNKYNYPWFSDSLFCDGYRIYKNGKWSKIVEYSITILGRVVEFLPKDSIVKIGCRSIAAEYIVGIYNFMEYFNIISCEVPEGKIQFSDIKKIVEEIRKW